MYSKRTIRLPLGVLMDWSTPKVIPLASGDHALGKRPAQTEFTTTTKPSPFATVIKMYGS